MPNYSSHAIILISRRYLLAKENDDFGYVFPGGEFTERDVQRAKSIGIQQVSQEVLTREIQKKLKPNFLLIDRVLGSLSDEITTKSEKIYHIDQMWFYTAFIQPSSLHELQRRASIPLRLMTREEIQKEVQSKAMKEILDRLPPYYP